MTHPTETRTSLQSKSPASKKISWSTTERTTPEGFRRATPVQPDHENGLFADNESIDTSGLNTYHQDDNIGDDIDFGLNTSPTPPSLRKRRRSLTGHEEGPATKKAAQTSPSLGKKGQSPMGHDEGSPTRNAGIGPNRFDCLRAGRWLDDRTLNTVLNAITLYPWMAADPLHVTTPALTSGASL